jgi:hypothetical protein
MLQLSAIWPRLGKLQATPKFVWCGGEHIQKECQEKENKESKSIYCNCKLEEGEKPHPSNCWGCKTAKEELQKKKLQKPQTKGTTAKVFTPRLLSSTVSYAEAIKWKENGQPR